MRCRLFMRKCSSTMAVLVKPETHPKVGGYVASASKDNLPGSLLKNVCIRTSLCVAALYA